MSHYAEKQRLLRAYHGTIRLCKQFPHDNMLKRNLMYDTNLMHELGYIACANIGKPPKRRTER